MKFRFLILLLLPFLVSCTTVHVDKKPSVDLSGFKHLFVEHRLNDNHGIDLLIVDELKKLGREVSAGPLTMMPDNADAIISYDDDWTFDFTTHMTVLQVRLRDADKETSLATGNYFNRSVTRNSPSDIVHQVITAMFKAK